MKTLAEVTRATGFEVLGHLEAEAGVPVLGGLQAQGDLIIVPCELPGNAVGAGGVVPPAGIAVIDPVGGGHEHRLFASVPGTAWWHAYPHDQTIGFLECTEPAYVLHPEHGATGIAPGHYGLRRQREQADEERLIAD